MDKYKIIQFISFSKNPYFNEYNIKITSMPHQWNQIVVKHVSNIKGQYFGIQYAIMELTVNLQTKHLWNYGRKYLK